MDTSRLEKLYELKEKGVLTAEEFEAQKQQMLAQEDLSVKTAEAPRGKGKSVFEYFIQGITSKYFDFKGRARRKEYFGFILGYFLLNLLVMFFVGFCAGAANVQNAENFYAVMNTLFTVFMIFPSLSVAARRLHDAGFCAWWMLVPFFLFVVAFFESEKKENRFGPVPEGVTV